LFQSGLPRIIVWVVHFTSPSARFNPEARMRRPTPSRPAAVEPLERRAYCAGSPRVTDVAISIQTVTAADITAGKRAPISLEFLNAGTAAVTRTVNYSLFLSTDRKFSANDRPLASGAQRISLKPGQSVTRGITPLTAADLPARDYNVIARLLPGTPDARKGNNTFVSPSRLTVVRPTAPAGKVDYSISFASMLPTSFPFGVNNPVSATLRNVGTAQSSQAVNVGLYASTDQVFGNADDIYLSGVTFSPKIKPKASVSADLSFITPLTFKTGFYYVAASIDTTNAVKEPSEANNVVWSGTKIHF
jgi:hypothetical protein